MKIKKRNAFREKKVNHFKTNFFVKFNETESFLKSETVKFADRFLNFDFNYIIIIICLVVYLMCNFNVVK